MDIDNIWAMDVSSLSERTLNSIRDSGEVGKSVWFACVKDPDVAFAICNQKDGTTTQVQVIPAPSGKILIARRSFFLKHLSVNECSVLRGGKNVLIVPYADNSPIVAGAPYEKEVYLIDRNTLRVAVIFY